MNKDRKVYFFWIVITILIGLLSRTSFVRSFLPDFGDILYGVMFFGIVGFIFPQWNSLKIALVAIGCCYLIEISQLADWDWLNLIRDNRLGRLVLGYGFLWMDLVYYTIGGILGYFMNEYGLNPKIGKN